MCYVVFSNFALMLQLSELNVFSVDLFQDNDILIFLFRCSDKHS